MLRILLSQIILKEYYEVGFIFRIILILTLWSQSFIIIMITIITRIGIISNFYVSYVVSPTLQVYV